MYEKLNAVVRRKPEENNFKAVLETIRDLMLVGDARPPPPVPGASIGAAGGPGAGASAGSAQTEQQQQQQADVQAAAITRPAVIPGWLHDLLLGYGDPNAAHYSKSLSLTSSLLSLF